MSTPYTVVPESLDQVLRDCRSMVGHWSAAEPPAEGVPLGRRGPSPAAAPLHGITVPVPSVRAVHGMAEYGA